MTLIIRGLHNTAFIALEAGFIWSVIEGTSPDAPKLYQTRQTVTFAPTETRY